MAYKVIILYQLYMPSYFLGTFTEYPYTNRHCRLQIVLPAYKILLRFRCFRNGNYLVVESDLKGGKFKKR